MEERADAEQELETESGQPGGSSPVDLENKDPYLIRARVEAEIRKARARTADRVALVLVSAVVGSLPLFLLAVALSGGTISTDAISTIFGKWYDVVSPLVGTAIGALFGIAIARPGSDTAR